MRTEIIANRKGLTLVEALATIAIISILVAILVPAVQSIRASARKTQCQNNLRQTALALHSFHTAKNSLPSPYSGTPIPYPLNQWDLFHMHSWRAALLPYIEQAAIHDSIDWNYLATDSQNESIATTVVSSYVCPSGQQPATSMGTVWRRNRENFQAVRSDYDGMAGIWVLFETPPVGTLDADTKYLRWSAWGSGIFDNGTASGNLIRYTPGKFRDVSDGLSNTILVVERTGRPLHIVDGSPNPTEYNPDAEYPGQIGWSASNPFIWRVNRRDVGINRDNAEGIYSNHSGGAAMAMTDGSVTFLSESTDIGTLAKMIGRSDGEQ